MQLRAMRSIVISLCDVTCVCASDLGLTYQAFQRAARASQRLAILAHSVPSWRPTPALREALLRTVAAAQAADQPQTLGNKHELVLGGLVRRKRCWHGP